MCQSLWRFAVESAGRACVRRAGERAAQHLRSAPHTLPSRQMRRSACAALRRLAGARCAAAAAGGLCHRLPPRGAPDARRLARCGAWGGARAPHRGFAAAAGAAEEKDGRARGAHSPGFAALARA